MALDAETTVRLVRLAPLTERGAEAVQSSIRSLSTWAYRSSSAKPAERPVSVR